MRVLLINPAFSNYGGLQGHGGNMLPFNLCYLAAYGRQVHPDVEFKILDSETLGFTHQATAEAAVCYSPDFIGITANTCVFDSVKEMIVHLKSRLPQVPVVIGGPHPSALPERSLRESKADFAVIGEGEITFAEMITCLKERKNNWAKIDGLAFWEEEQIRVNSPRQLIENLDILPFPARDLVDNRLYSPPPTKRVSLGPNTLISTSRGCPYNCGFCGARTVWTRRLRTRSTESVLAEIEECVAEYGINSFNFTDELFTVNKKKIMEICQLICKRNLKIRWVCSARAQGLDSLTLRAMKRAGCYEISFGIESGSPKILKRIDKGINLQEALGVVRLTKKAGITTHASYILGYLGETEETLQQTIRFAKKLNTDIAAFFIASPLPGTRLYKEALDEGCLRPDASWANYSPLSNLESALTLPDLTTAMIRRWHRKALRSYYLRPRYFVSRILRIRHWYEVANLLGGLKIFLSIKK